MSAGWKSSAWFRLDYLAHRWIGTLLGVVIFSWFASGIAMVFYPWPLITETRGLALLEPFEPDSTLIGFSRAARAAAAALPEGGADAAPVRARLQLIGDRPVYRVWNEQGGVQLVDARSGAVLSPISPMLAEAAARAVVGTAPGIISNDLLARGDRYMMNGDYAGEFPAYRVRFDDARQTAVYVSSRSGAPFGVVTRLTRFTTWTGTVPHWFYFRWLYERYRLWDGAIIGIASLGTLLGLTGMAWGLVQLIPRRRPGGPALSAYRTISRWHHLAGLGFGALVVGWCLSGVWENLGSGSGPRRGQMALIRGRPTRWEAVRLTEYQALLKSGVTERPVAVDLEQFDGRPGYLIHFGEGSRAWVDAGNGESRRELDERAIRRAAERAMASSAMELTRLTEPDDYYRPGHEREAPLPVWRALFHDREASRLYLDPVSGRIMALVGAGARRTRWGRDALHGLDFRFLATRPGLWGAIILTLLLGGTISSGTGLMLALRRAWRSMGRRSGE